VDKQKLEQRANDQMNALLPEFLETPPDVNELVAIASLMGVILTRKQAMQALYFARDFSMNPKHFSTYSLVTWFSDNLSHLRSTKKDNIRSRNSSTILTTKAFGATLGVGGAVGTRANAVASEILAPMHTFENLRLNNSSTMTLQGKLIR